jgi:hypothetical protein
VVIIQHVQSGSKRIGGLRMFNFEILQTFEAAELVQSKGSEIDALAVVSLNVVDE